MLAIVGFLGMAPLANADRGGNGNGNHGNGNGNGGPILRSPEPSAVVSFLVFAGMAYAVKRRISNKETESKDS